MEARLEGRPEGSPPRAWQTGERRSPPSEASESRRRTRPRHGSLRNATPSGPHYRQYMGQQLQQQMQLNQRPQSYNFGAGRPSNMPPLQPTEPLGLTPPSIQQSHAGSGYPPALNPVQDHRFPHNAMPGGPLPLEPGQLSNPSQMAAYAHQLPPVGALDNPSFSGGSGATHSHSNLPAEWLH